MSIKWKLPLTILAVFLLNIMILSIFYRFYLSDKLNNRLIKSQNNVDQIALMVTHEANNKSLSDAEVIIKKIASEKNVAVTLKKIGSSEEYTIKTSKNNAEIFSSSREIVLNKSFYMVTVKKLTSIPNLQNVEVVKDILNFEFVVLFILLLIIDFVLYMNYAKPLVRLRDEILQYRNGKTVKTHVTRRDELGQLQSSFYEFMDSLNEEKQIQDRIIASISHDIKTPLTSVLGYSENLIKKELPPERKNRYLNTIYNQAKDIEGIVEEFDEYIADKLDMELHRQKYTVKYLCGMLKDEYSELLTERSMGFEIEYDSSFNGSVSIDLVKFRRVVANIIGNSIRHANTQKLKISITVWKKSNKLFFKISDNGGGVKEDVLPQIFQPFYTSDKSRRVSGLGLSICKDIIYAHGGSITAENNSDNGLSVIFSIQLEE